jgi:hypothetical protein
MGEFNLDLRNAEAELEAEEGQSPDVVLGLLDGETEPTEWIDEVRQGNVLVLSVQGELNQLAAGFARDVKELGGELMHFRGFLVVSPPGVTIDTDRL